MHRRGIRTHTQVALPEEVIARFRAETGKVVAGAIRRELDTPVAAGGRREGLSPTLSQDHLQFVDGIDEVPEPLRPLVWSLATRHNQLTNVSGSVDFYKLKAGVRLQLRLLVWRGKLTLNEATNVEYYVDIQLRKSLHAGERRFIAPGFSQVIREEYAADTNSIINEPQHGFAGHGVMQKLGIGGSRRSQRY